MMKHRASRIADAAQTHAFTSGGYQPYANVPHVTPVFVPPPPVVQAPPIITITVTITIIIMAYFMTSSIITIITMVTITIITITVSEQLSGHSKRSIIDWKGSMERSDEKIDKSLYENIMKR
ncbi:hypothetical protein Y032_0070g472 [Ancylostoma ceylanicum]|uniref:Uncharacterized protein n=1 Tax=Ancylostoma ceylanicum TaxID=53326 RepID=A0A016TXL8_9BILA|nr:hypothetical protein Y032_0070g472 [Ancylostoma ceylanicum]